MKHYVVYTEVPGYLDGETIGYCRGHKELRELLAAEVNASWDFFTGPYWSKVVTPVREVLAMPCGFWAVYRTDGHFNLVVSCVTKSEYEQFVQMIEDGEYL